MSTFTIYDDATGEILRVEGHSYGVTPTLLDGQSYLEGKFNDAIQYVVADVITDKAAMGVSIDKTTADADGVDTATITGVPNGAQVSVVNGFLSLLSEAVTDGEVELTAEEAITMKVSLRLFPFLDYDTEVTFHE